MPGPAPKHSSVRARRNRTSTAATLKVIHSVQAPPLPARDWNPLTEQWWADVWASPMAPEYHSSDRHGLFMLALLVDAFWDAPAPVLAAEIRLQRQCFGLTPIDRRRLQWEIERVEEAQEKGARRRASSSSPAAAGSDPRDALRAL